MKYFVSKVDSKGFTHSIDNLVVAYDFKSISYSTVKKMIPDIQELGKKHETNYYDALDVNACRKYHFSKDYIHLDDGIVLFFGSQVEKLDKPLKGGDRFYTLPLVKLKINPNKHADKPVLKELLKILKRDTCDVRLISFDYAIDIPKPPSDVQVFGTRKEKGLHKHTRYFGQRDKNGFTRIYDKAIEQDLDTPLTRVETVINLAKGTKNYSFEKVFVKSDTAEKEKVKLTKTDEAIIELCNLLRANGLEYDQGLEKLEPRKKRFIREQLTSGTYEPLDFNEKILNELLEDAMKFFDVTALPDQGTKEELQVDLEGFVIMPDNLDLPFE